MSLLASVPYVVGASAETPVATLKELIAKARAEPGKLTYSSCGNGTLCHLSGELFKTLTGTDLLHVPFKGSAPAVQALLGNQVDLAFDTLTILAPQVKAGKVKGLVITSSVRSLLVPDVPTAREAGLPDFVVSSWFGLVVPAATPKDIVDRLTHEIGYIAALPTVRERLSAQGLDAIASTQQDFARVIGEDYLRWGRVVQTSGAKLD